MTSKAVPFKLPYGLIGMLALLGAVEGFVDRGASRFMSWIELDWRIVGRDAVTKAKGSDVLILGDSMLKFGVAPRVLEQSIGHSVYSLALLDGKPAASYFLLRRALEAGARPKVVLVDYQPECMREPPAELMRNRHWKGLLTLRECWDVFVVYLDPEFLARAVCARLLPSYRCRDGLRGDVLAAVQGTANANLDDNARNARNRRLNRGALLLAKKPAFNGSLPKSFERHMYVKDWASLRVHNAFVHRFLALARRHGVTVVWVMPPNVPELERKRVERGLSDRFTDYALRFQSLYPNLVVVDGRAAGYDHQLFVDAVHLDRDGATALTLGIADTLRALLAGEAPTRADDRWIALPAPERLATPPVLEDMDQSLRIVTGSRDKVRR